MREPVPDQYSRDRPIEIARTALLVIDVQNATWSDTDAELRPELHRTVRDVTLPNIARLQAACRSAGIEVMFTVIENLTLDGRDRSLDYKASGINVSKGSWGARMPSAVAPIGDEIVLPKTSSGLFNSTNFDYLLHNMGIDSILVTGLLTDQCVDITVRDGADRGYWMTCVSDACATETRERHEHALRAFGGYCRVLTTDATLALVAGAH
jgi:nicotinamidase-related amidase